MSQDALVEFKNRQREMWASFAPISTFTTPVAARLVRFAQIAPGESVLDVGCGTGVVAITAARAGARVAGLDLTPALLDHARENQAIAGLSDISWTEGDAEALPFADDSFDVVVSQFGHMFAPRPEVVVAEMRRVLRAGGRVAFATWPPEHFVGRFFALVGRHSPPPPGAAPPPLWGSVTTIAERLAGRFGPPFFGRGVMTVAALSPAHVWEAMSQSVGPLQALAARLADTPDQLAALRQEFIALAEPYHADNMLHQDYLLTRARAS